MKLSDKINGLRKSNEMSQEDLAEKLDVSRQASTFILQNVFFGFLSFIPFVAAIGGFEYAYQKKASSATEKTKNFRRKLYCSSNLR